MLDIRKRHAQARIIILGDVAEQKERNREYKSQHSIRHQSGVRRDDGAVSRRGFEHAEGWKGSWGTTYATNLRLYFHSMDPVTPAILFQDPPHH